MLTSPNLAVAFVIAAAVACSPRAPEPWLTDEPTAFALARHERKAVLIDLFATWSVSSVALSELLDTPGIRAAFGADFVPLRLDVSVDDERVDELRARYRTQTLPALVLVETDGDVLARVEFLPDRAELAATIAEAARRRAR